MIRSLRAFMWLRWHLLVNAIRGSERRDTLERVSRTLAVMAPILLLVMSFGSLVAISILGFVGGRATASGLLDPVAVVFVVRVVLGVLFALVLLMTVLAPMQTIMSSYNRLLLLPIPRASLHLVEVVANLTDPWITVVVPGLFTFAIGLTVGGRLGMAVVVAAAGVAVVFVLISLAALVSFLLGWLLRSRRRGEMFTLVFVLGLSMVSIVPGLVSSNRDAQRKARQSQGRPRREPFSVAQFDASLPRWAGALPSELYGTAIGAAARHEPGIAWLAVLMLGFEGAVIFAASSAVHGRLIVSLENEHERHRRAAKPLGGWQLPFVGAWSSAVALASLRTGLRSVRGRLSILLPGPLLLALSVLFRRMPEAPAPIVAVLNHGGLVFAAGSVLALHALQPFTMNLFGTDRAGLTLLFLQPLSDLTLVRGKVLGCGLLLGTAMSLCLVVSVIVAPSGSPWTWISVPIGMASICTLLGPVAVWASALFPVPADLSKTGSGGNPHPLAMLAGTLTVMALSVPPALFVFIGEYWLQRPALVPLLMSGWLAFSFLLAWPLFVLAARAVTPRRENLALLRK